jgi:D-glycero-alpha-D-manno-heptose 1-phosphate guanylyltransferase
MPWRAWLSIATRGDTMLATLDRFATRLSDIPAVILAGGLGTRLRAAVADVPKVLAPVHGRPFLTHVLERLAAASLRRAVLLTGYRADDVERTIGTRCGPLRLEYSRETRPLGTGGALRQALACLDGPTILLLNGDSCCDIDLPLFFAWHRRRCADLTMAVARVADASRFGRVQLSTEGKVVRFVEKAAAARPGWINAGVYLIQRRLLESMPPGQSLSLEREWLHRWITTERVLGFRCAGPFLDIGTPESYAAAESFFESPTR